MNHDQQQPPTAVEDSARDVRAQQLQSSRLRVALFKNLQVECAEDRQVALEKIIQVVKSFLRVARSPFSASSSEATPVLTCPVRAAAMTPKSETDHAGITHDALTYDESMTDEQLRYFLLTMLRLAHSCPFGDVRQTFKDFLQKTADSRVMFAPQASHLSPSIFIPLKDIFSLESSASSRAFISYPRPEHLSISPWSQDTDDEDSRRRPELKPDLNREALCSTGGRPSDEYVRQMMTKTFVDEGRLANVFRVMSFFPTFYEIYSTTYTQTLKSSLGPVARTWKCYLGILASAEHQCQYLVSILRLEFLQAGGDPTWLKGIDYAPLKLRHISRLVLKLSRQPWRLSADDLTGLIRRPGAVVSETWSKGELVQAIVVIATFLGLSSFVLACGIAPEMDMRGGYYVHGRDDDNFLEGVEHELDEWAPSSPGKDSADVARAAASAATGWHDSSISVDMHHQPFTSDNGLGLGVSVDDAEEMGDQTNDVVYKLKSSSGSPLKNVLLESLEKLNLTKDKQQLAADDEETNSLDTAETPTSEELPRWTFNQVYEDLTRFTDTSAESSLLPQDHDDTPVNDIVSGDYCWEDHGCDLVNQFLPGLGESLDDEFNEALSITDWTIFHNTSDSNIDTSPLRRAIWYYTQKNLGLTKEDYDYQDISTYLSARHKEYIRKVCHRPSEILYSDWNNIGMSLRPEEKCHVNLLVASAKKQALLCYGFAAVDQV
ncbi:PA26 p53-induced protein-domain-containing protein [Fennellomyces sp. T-0311]|nr:PA26 p53-induced protein-domain-containing protein [Fennellomyces sp. T-0311]